MKKEKYTLEKYCDLYKKIKSKISDNLLIYGFGIILWSCVIFLFIKKFIM